MSDNELRSSILSSLILIVDDMNVNLMLLEKTLRSKGFTNIILAENGTKALEMVDKYKPDLVILDIVMPEIDGLECCKRIRQNEEYRDLPILFQTAVDERDIGYKAFAHGGTDFVQKPIHPAELCARVTLHLERRLYLRGFQIYKERVEQELESARQMQNSILPTKKEMGDMRQQCGMDIASHFAPSSELGGDFWGMKKLFPHQVAVWIVDFSGHGVASAMNTFRLQAYLNEHSQLATRPGEYLSHLNEKLLHLLLPEQFATMFYAIIDTKGNQMFYSSAGNPHPIIVRDSTKKAEIIDGSGIPLGINMHIYPTHITSFGPRDTLVLYSDVLTETPGKDGSYMEEQEIMKIMEDNFDRSSEQKISALLDRFHKLSNVPIMDDLTICICKRGFLNNDKS